MHAYIYIYIYIYISSHICVYAGIKNVYAATYHKDPGTCECQNILFVKAKEVMPFQFLCIYCEGFRPDRRGQIKLVDICFVNIYYEFQNVRSH